MKKNKQAETTNPGHFKPVETGQAHEKKTLDAIVKRLVTIGTIIVLVSNLLSFGGSWWLNSRYNDLAMRDADKVGRDVKIQMQEYADVLARNKSRFDSLNYFTARHDSILNNFDWLERNYPEFTTGLASLNRANTTLFWQIRGRLNSISDVLIELSKNDPVLHAQAINIRDSLKQVGLSIEKISDQGEILSFIVRVNSVHYNDEVVQAIIDLGFTVAPYRLLGSKEPGNSGSEAGDMIPFIRLGRSVPGKVVRTLVELCYRANEEVRMVEFVDDPNVINFGGYLKLDDDKEIPSKFEFEKLLVGGLSDEEFISRLVELIEK